MLKAAQEAWNRMTNEDRTLDVLKKELWTRTALIAISGLLTVTTALGGVVAFLAGREFNRMTDGITGLKVAFEDFGREFAVTTTEVRYLKENAASKGDIINLEKRVDRIERAKD